MTVSDEHQPHDGDHPNDEILSRHAKRILAVQELLEKKGYLDRGELQDNIDIVKSRSPANGAKVVARAWMDTEFKRRLMEYPRGAISEMGYCLPTDSELYVLENTPKLHHLVVCTLCSCYPHGLLGPPPDWYKSFAYRSRAVIEPRKVMEDFGLCLGNGVEVRVVDSTADLRYMVLPVRPCGTEAMPEDELAALVTRDSMIGVGRPMSK